MIFTPIDTVSGVFKIYISKSDSIGFCRDTDAKCSKYIIKKLFSKFRMSIKLFVYKEDSYDYFENDYYVVRRNTAHQKYNHIA